NPPGQLLIGEGHDRNHRGGAAEGGDRQLDQFEDRVEQLGRQQNEHYLAVLDLQGHVLGTLGDVVDRLAQRQQRRIGTTADLLQVVLRHIERRRLTRLSQRRDDLRDLAVQRGKVGTEVKPYLPERTHAVLVRVGKVLP